MLKLKFGAVSWQRDESYVGLCWEVRGHPPGGGLPSASRRCFSGPSSGEASADLVKFGDWALNCIMAWVGPTTTVKSCLMGDLEASPGHTEGPGTTLSDLFLIMSRAGWPMLLLWLAWSTRSSKASPAPCILALRSPVLLPALCSLAIFVTGPSSLAVVEWSVRPGGVLWVRSELWAGLW